MDNPTFAERTAALKTAAQQLQAAATVVMQEAERMEAAQSRFQQRVKHVRARGPAQKR
jgi:hypothetical protein